MRALYRKIEREEESAGWLRRSLFASKELASGFYARVGGRSVHTNTRCIEIKKGYSSDSYLAAAADRQGFGLVMIVGEKTGSSE